MVIAAVRTHFPRKNTSMFISIGLLSREKKRVLKLTFSNSVSVRDVVACVSACDVGDSSSILTACMFISFFLFYFFIFLFI